MEQDLLELLEFQDVLTAVATTRDGLVVASAGLSGDDAEAVAAAGSAVVDSLGEDATRSPQAVELDGGVMHLACGRELMLVVLAEPSVPGEELGSNLAEALDRIEAAFAE